MYYIRVGDLESVKKLVESDPGVIYYKSQMVGLNLLENSIINYNLDLVKYFYEIGLRIERQYLGRTLLYHSMSCFDILEYLVLNGVDVNECYESNGCVILHDTIFYSNVEDMDQQVFFHITKFLLEHGADPYIKNYGGHTPIDCCKNKEEFLNLIRLTKLNKIYGK